MNGAVLFMRVVSHHRHLLLTNSRHISMVSRPIAYIQYPLVNFIKNLKQLLDIKPQNNVFKAKTLLNLDIAYLMVQGYKKAEKS